MKSKLASFVVDHRIPILVIMLIVTAVSAFLMTRVRVNNNLTEYLPEKSVMKQGMDIMSAQFPETASSQTIRVVFDCLEPEEKEEIREKLRGIPYVSDVAWEEDSPDYNQGDHTLYVISSEAGYKSAEFKSIKKALEQDFPDDEISWHDDDVGIPEVPAWILLCGVFAVLVILLVMCGSWIEPFLFLAGIGSAVLINQGSNIVQGSISIVTFSMSAILQLVLSMDYSIILSSRFRQEKEKNEDKAAAMKAAVTNAFPTITSSGMTTVAGLLMLVFMSFTIGKDLGVVLAKGVFLSMFCVLTVMPGVLLSCDDLIGRTAKKSPKIPMNSLSAFSGRMHTVITAVFVVLMAAAFILQQKTGIVYTMQREDPIAEIFPADNTLVLLYENEDEPQIPGICEYLKQDSGVRSVTCYYSALNTPYTAEEMARNMPEMQEGMKLDAEVLSLFYYLRYGKEEPQDMTVTELLSFLSGHVAGNELFEEYMTDDQREMLAQIGNYAGLVGLLVGNEPLTPKEMADKFSGFSPDMNEESLELLYLFRTAIENSDPQWTMTLEEFFTLLCDTVQSDPRFAPLVGEDAQSMLGEARRELADGKAQLVGDTHSRMIITTKYPDEAEETFDFIDRLSAECEKRFGGKHYVIGNSAMNLEMSRSFGKEYLFITVLTAVVIYLIVALTTRSFIIPLILVLLVQTGVFISVAGIGLFGDRIFYLALLIVQCILMGATIDYGILFTNLYIEYRRRSGMMEAVRKAYERAINTIATSGLILTLVPTTVGRFFRDPTIAAIANTLSLGSLIAIILILVCLPGILITFDRVVAGRNAKRQP